MPFCRSFLQKLDKLIKSFLKIATKKQIKNIRMSPTHSKLTSLGLWKMFLFFFVMWTFMFQFISWIWELDMFFEMMAQMQSQKVSSVYKIHKIRKTDWVTPDLYDKISDVGAMSGKQCWHGIALKPSGFIPSISSLITSVQALKLSISSMIRSVDSRLLINQLASTSVLPKNIH